MYGEYPNGGIIEAKSHDMEFLDKESPSIGDMWKNIGLYELQDNTIPSAGEGD